MSHNRNFFYRKGSKFKITPYLDYYAKDDFISYLYSIQENNLDANPFWMYDKLSNSIVTNDSAEIITADFKDILIKAIAWLIDRLYTVEGIIHIRTNNTDEIIEIQKGSKLIKHSILIENIVDSNSIGGIHSHQIGSSIHDDFMKVINTSKNPENNEKENLSIRTKDLHKYIINFVTDNLLIYISSFKQYICSCVKYMNTFLS